MVPSQIASPTASGHRHARSTCSTAASPATAWLPLVWLVVASILAAGGCGGERPAAEVERQDLSVTMPGAGEDAPLEAPIDPPRVDTTGSVTAADSKASAGPDVSADAGDSADSGDAAEAVAAAAGDRESDSSDPVAADDGAAAAASAENSDPAGEGPEDWRTWPAPQVALVVTGNQHGYIEPCGCTGLKNQKGGLARRMTFIKELKDLGWEVVPLDAGNQVRRFGRQAEIKFQVTATGLDQMNYRAVGFGPDDLRLGVGELIAVAAAEGDPQEGMFVSANVTLLDPSLTAQQKVVEAGGQKIGITTVLDPQAMETESSGEIEVAPVTDAMSEALTAMQSGGADFRVLMYYGEEDAAQAAVQQVPGFDLVVVAGGYGEPLYRPQAIENSQTKMIVTGNKGMYAGIVGLYPDADQPYRYARVAMSHDFGDAAAMRQLMAAYQNQLEAIGLAGLGLRPIPHPSGKKFVGTQTCGQCHTTAYEIWENTPHAMATEDIVNPYERGDVARHFDPECLSCHVTGWNPQHYYPYESGYLSLAASSHLTGNGCENCHGPGSDHVAAEQGDVEVNEDQREALRAAMRLPLDKARDRCLECHDLDNSPDFHKEDAFEDYWAEIEHYGLD